MLLLLFLLVPIVGIFIIFKILFYGYLSINLTKSKFIALFIAIIYLCALIVYLGLNNNSLPLLITYASFSYYNLNKYNILKVYITKNKVNTYYETLPLQSHLTGKDALLYKLLFGGIYIGGAFILTAFADITVYSFTGSTPLVDLDLDSRIQDMQEIVTELSRLLPQLNLFITQFHSFVNQASINIVTDAEGNLGVDVLQSVSDSVATNYANRVNIFDNLIHDRVHAIEELINRGSALEVQILQSDNNYVSQLSEFRSRLALLIRTYGHINT